MEQVGQHGGLFLTPMLRTCCRKPYTVLSAAVADIAHPDWRASAMGIYRFWRDMGYGFGAFGIGIAATVGGAIESAFWFVAAAMALSGLALQRLG